MSETICINKKLWDQTRALLEERKIAINALEKVVTEHGKTIGEQRNELAAQRRTIATLRARFECTNAGGDCPMAVCSGSYDNRDEAIAAWNTRAAPTMKPWVWVERNACHDPLGHVWHCENYNAFMVRDGANWKTRIGNEHICSLPIKEAQAACVAYVEGKLKEWLVP